MAFMDQFNQQPQQSGSKLSEVLNLAKGIAGNDPRAALQRMSEMGVTCNLPDGRTMSVSELMSMAEGKTPQQLLASLGIK